MIDLDNLRTASLYINNQLLSRGLLRDGQTIDFAGTGKGEDDTTTTTGKIISIVNDLILRRDVSGLEALARGQQTNSMTERCTATRIAIDGNAKPP